MRVGVLWCLCKGGLGSVNACLVPERPMSYSSKQGLFTIGRTQQAARGMIVFRKSPIYQREGGVGFVKE